MHDFQQYSKVSAGWPSHFHVGTTCYSDRTFAAVGGSASAAYRAFRLVQFEWYTSVPVVELGRRFESDLSAAYPKYVLVSVGVVEA